MKTMEESVLKNVGVHVFQVGHVAALAVTEVVPLRLVDGNEWI